jgi:uncharacterized repeat protein (TIGR03803 family)
MAGCRSNGVIFSLRTDGTTFQLLHKFGSTHHDGKNPYGSLLLVGNQLYGTTANGGDYCMGTVFVINTDGTGYSRLHSFGGTKHDGVKPIDNVILLNGALYGRPQRAAISTKEPFLAFPRTKRRHNLFPLRTNL